VLDRPMTSAADIRRALGEDAEHIADLYARTLRDAYGGLMPTGFSDPVSVERRAAKLRPAIAAGTRVWFVAFSSSTLVGFCGLSPARDIDLTDDFGEITVVAVERSSRRRGYGRALIELARGEAARRGWHTLVLWVVACNADARAFYDRDGWSADGATKVDDRLGFSAPVIRYRAKLARTST
jgi:GNAT superfamily N-acetyltransferase